MGWRDKAKLAMRVQDITQEKMAEHLGVSQGGIGHWLNGRREPSLDVLEQMAIRLGYSLPDFISDESTPDEAFPRPATGENFAIIPYYDAKASCGNGYFNDHIELKNGLAFSRRWLTKRGLQEENLIIIGASGDSMWPTFSNGATLLVNRAIDKPKSGKVYLITENGEERVKRLFQEFTGEWRIASDNPNKAIYPDTAITPQQMQDLKITGQVVWFDGEL